MAQSRLAAYENIAEVPSEANLSPRDSMNAISEFHGIRLKLAITADNFPQAYSYMDAYTSFHREEYLTVWAGLDVGAFRSYAKATEKAPMGTEAFEEEYVKNLYQEANPGDMYTPYYLPWYLQSGYSIFNYPGIWEAQLTQLDSVDSVSGHEVDELINAYVNNLVYGELNEVNESFIQDFRDDKFLVMDSLQIPVGDGVMLDGYVVMPKGAEGPLPTSLQANPYVADMEIDFYQYWGAERGYAGMVVFPRGIRLSDGEFAPFEMEATDLPKVIDWITQQPWSDGQVGMHGGSYLGFSQWAALKNPHPALKTVVPQVSVGIGVDYPSHNRVFMNYALQWINFVTNSNLMDIADFSNQPYWDSLFMQWYTSDASVRVLDTLDEAPDKIYQRWLDHPDYDNYWKDMVASSPEEFAAIDIPILTTTGFFDDDQRGALHYYEMHNRYGKPEVVDNHYLVIGPYDHGGGQGLQTRGVVGDIVLPRDAVTDFFTVIYDWFDYVMRDGPKPEVLKDRVNHYIMGKGWQHLPAVSAISDTLTMFPVGNPGSSPASLGDAPEAGTALLTEDFTTDSLDKLNFNILLHEKELLPHFLEEGLVWDSEPLDEELVIAGKPQVQLTFTPNVKDVDLKVYFMEVSPTGEMMKMSEVLQRASYAHQQEERQLLTPGEPVTLTLAHSIWISRKMAPGTRLRVIVSVNSDPDWQKNYGSGRPVADETAADFVPIELEFDLEKSSFSFPLAPTGA
ncbi:MAG: CocE/NonD family hydrolase [Bacteroidota bacterium]